jgi:tRNA pseudouridine38-40 synthase
VRTVGGVLERALSRLFDEPVKVTAAGRTDSGVHATGQVVSVTTRARFAFDRLTVALNAVLPADCSIREAAIVEAGFSARFAALERTYVYAILNRLERDALLARYAWHLSRALDLRAMEAAAAAFIGEHDFRSFCGTLPVGPGGEPSSTVRTISRLSVSASGPMVRVEVAANGFLHRMVRSLVGTLAECGMGKREAGQMEAILAAAERSEAGVAAPASGLYLAGVRYPGGYDSFAEPPVLGGRPGPLDGPRPFP